MRVTKKCLGTTRGVQVRLVVALMVLALLATGLLTAYAVVRSSASYAISIDATTAAGGASDSASYQEPDSGMGESIASGPCTSASYKERAGVVMPWAEAPAVEHWEQY